MAPQLAGTVSLQSLQVGGDFVLAGVFPAWGGLPASQAISAGSLTLNAQVTALMGGLSVWAVIVPPDYTPPTVSGDFVSTLDELPKVALVDQDPSTKVLDGLFQGSYNFTKNGAYTVIFYAKDSDKNLIKSAPVTMTVSGGVEVTTTFPLALSKGWSLLSSTISLQTATIFADENTFTSVWKWTDNNSGVKTWAVYLPGADSVAYANSKGFISLAEIKSGEGFWVNSTVAKQVDISGTPVYGSVSLTQGWNLVGLKGTKPVAAADLGAVTSVWKWTNGTWAVYLPGAEDKGEAYALAKGFGMLTTIEPGGGFWVNAPAPVEVAGSK